MCSKHNQPINYLCLHKDCKDVTGCQDCLKKEHAHANSNGNTFYISFKDVAKEVPKKVAEKTLNMPPAVKLSQANKKELEQQQILLIDRLKRVLAFQRKTLSDELQVLAVVKKSQEIASLKLYSYFAKIYKIGLIQLKMSLLGDRGITDFRNKLVQLHNIGEKEYEAARQCRKIKQKMKNKASEVKQSGYSRKINQIFNEQRLSSVIRKRSFEPQPRQPLSFTRKASQNVLKASPSRIISCKKF